MESRPNFTSSLRHDIIVVYDHSHEAGGESVRKNPRAVVAYCLYHFGSNHRIIARDPSGIWSELLHDGNHFLAIEQLAADELEDIAELCGLDVG